MAKRNIQKTKSSPPLIFTEFLKVWDEDGSKILLELVWQAYDLLKEENLAQLDERYITQCLEPNIHKVMNGFEPFYIQHGPYENETKKPPPAQPPQPDLAFILNEDRRSMWPLEAKLLHSDKAVAQYIKEIHDNFLTCRYAPFSGEAAMLGYLLKGKAQNAFDEIAKKLECTLFHYPYFLKRPHKISKHYREIPQEKNYPENFKCHHLIMEIFT
ncbi:hypothetical protein [Spirulina sp. 06S082]|uniref:hypothetical protein n=1 Tax=Spirulina sp. 06S082 TaxID=3110248 RepID=UPI002B2052BA|nr:hypothetical protein [Spirulina sp. 06S082]MEA5472211.1 hypothetical protein [Spirulina sp. 06S082]